MPASCALICRCADIVPHRAVLVAVRYRGQGAYLEDTVGSGSFPPLPRYSAASSSASGKRVPQAVSDAYAEEGCCLSTDMLLSLPMLLLESSSESLAGWR